VKIVAIAEKTFGIIEKTSETDGKIAEMPNMTVDVVTELKTGLIVGKMSGITEKIAEIGPKTARTEIMVPIEAAQVSIPMEDKVNDKQAIEAVSLAVVNTGVADAARNLEIS
jgi:hypothetical protein